YTGRSKIVKFEGHYHGWFDTILVSVAPSLDQAGPEDVPLSHLPSAGQSAVAAGDVVVLPWNNLDAVRRYLEGHAAEAAALIMELTGNGSVLHGGSFNGHTASIAAGLATLEELSREGVYEQMEARGDALMGGLRQVADRAGIPFLVQGLGTVFNTAFTDQSA